MDHPRLVSPGRQLEGWSYCPFCPEDEGAQPCPIAGRDDSCPSRTTGTLSVINGPRRLTIKRPEANLDPSVDAPGFFGESVRLEEPLVSRPSPLADQGRVFRRTGQAAGSGGLSER